MSKIDVVAGLILGLIVVAAFWYVFTVHQFKIDCIAKGGVPFLGRDAHICLAPNMVIK